MGQSIATLQRQIIGEKATHRKKQRFHSKRKRRKYRDSCSEAAGMQVPKRLPSPREQLEGLLPLLEHPTRLASLTHSQFHSEALRPGNKN